MKSPQDAGHPCQGTAGSRLHCSSPGRGLNDNLNTWEFPKIRATLWGPYIIFAPIKLGSPYLEKLPYRIICVQSQECSGKLKSGSRQVQARKAALQAWNVGGYAPHRPSDHQRHQSLGKAQMREKELQLLEEDIMRAFLQDLFAMWCSGGEEAGGPGAGVENGLHACRCLTVFQHFES